MSTTVANMLTWVEYRLFSSSDQTLTTTSEPSQAECLQWINEVCEELLTVCVTTSSEIGRAMATVTLSDGDSDYPEYQNLIFAPIVMKDSSGEQFSGWIHAVTHLL